MSMYLAELDSPEDDTSHLYAFDDEDELTSTLRGLIEAAHYSGLGYTVKGIWRWLGDGDLQEMNLKLLEQKRELDDWLDWYYMVTPADGTSGAVRFTVRIDGRS